MNHWRSFFLFCRLNVSCIFMLTATGPWGIRDLMFSVSHQGEKPVGNLVYPFQPDPHVRFCKPRIMLEVKGTVQPEMTIKASAKPPC